MIPHPEISVNLVHALHEAMRGLQFEDMSTQNIHYSTDTLRLLEPIAHAMEVGAKNLQGVNSSLDEQLKYYQKKINARKQSPVTASSMASGDIDLF